MWLLCVAIRNLFGAQWNVIYKLLDYIQNVKKYYMLDRPIGTELQERGLLCISNTVVRKKTDSIFHFVFFFFLWSAENCTRCFCTRMRNERTIFRPYLLCNVSAMPSSFHICNKLIFSTIISFVMLYSFRAKRHSGCNSSFMRMPKSSGALGYSSAFLRSIFFCFSISVADRWAPVWYIHPFTEYFESITYIQIYLFILIFFFKVHCIYLFGLIR